MPPLRANPQNTKSGATEAATMKSDPELIAVPVGEMTGSSSRVVYKAEVYAVGSTDRLKSFDLKSRFDLKLGGSKDGQKPVLEIITMVWTVLRRNPAPSAPPRPTRQARHVVEDSSDDEDRKVRTPSSPRPQDDVALPDKLEDLEISSIGDSRIVIHSPFLLNAIRRTIQYYPGQDLTGDQVVIYEPYMCLAHYYSEIAALAKPCETGGQDTSCFTHKHHTLCDESTKDHVRLLLDEVLEAFMENKIRPALDKLSQPVPVVTFEMAWLLFRPGVDLYSHFKSWRSVAIPSVAYEIRLKRRPITEEMDERPDKRDPLPWAVYSWGMCGSGEDVGRTKHTTYIDVYEGEKEVTQLDVYPCEYWDHEHGPERKESFIKWGKKYYELLKKGHQEVYVDGLGTPDVTGYTIPAKYRGRAIIDQISTAKYALRDKTHMLRFRREIRISFIMNCNPEVIGDRSPHLIESDMDPRSKFDKYDSLGVDSDDKMTEHHFFLMLPLMGGFALQEKEWMIFHVSGIQDASYGKESLENLVLDKTDIGIIKAVSHKQNAGTTYKTVDFIPGKGQGQVILLHGPPGGNSVGKTYTVEGIASHFQRPLLSLSIADLGTGEDSEEDNFTEGKLTRWLNLAETWNAVLLIDEADVFLERRGKDNIARNGLVSVFLRKIEYFSGLLFLTTNRIGQIDDAFPSRLHAIINYPPLDDSKRIAIWKAFFKKLSLERKGQLVIESKAQEYVLHHQDIRDRKWNGREIRNALQTAIALAEYDVAVEPDLQDQKIRVNKDHFQQVMDMSRKFTEYMADLSGKTEAERARSRKDRSDDHHRGDLGFEEGRLTPYRTG